MRAQAEAYGQKKTQFSRPVPGYFGSVPSSHVPSCTSRVARTVPSLLGIAVLMLDFLSARLTFPVFSNGKRHGVTVVPTPEEVLQIKAEAYLRRYGCTVLCNGARTCTLAVVSVSFVSYLRPAICHFSRARSTAAVSFLFVPDS